MCQRRKKRRSRLKTPHRHTVVGGPQVRREKSSPTSAGLGRERLRQKKGSDTYLGGVPETQRRDPGGVCLCKKPGGERIKQTPRTEETRMPPSTHQAMVSIRMEDPRSPFIQYRSDPRRCEWGGQERNSSIEEKEGANLGSERRTGFISTGKAQKEGKGKEALD